MGSAASVFQRRHTALVAERVCHSHDFRGELARDRMGQGQSSTSSTSPNHWVSQRAPTTPWVYSRIMAYNAEEWAARFGRDVAPELATTVPTDQWFPVAARMACRCLHDQLHGMDGPELSGHFSHWHHQLGDVWKSLWPATNAEFQYVAKRWLENSDLPNWMNASNYVSTCDKVCKYYFSE